MTIASCNAGGTLFALHQIGAHPISENTFVTRQTDRSIPLVEIWVKFTIHPLQKFGGVNQ